MKLSELARLFLISHIEGSDVEVTGLEIDSRHVKRGDLFICLPGTQMDGHDFVTQAYDNGAVAIVAEKNVDVSLPKLYVADSRQAMAMISTHFYGYPSEQMSLIGITGTNGKTSTCYLLEQILADQAWRTGMMGTIEMKFAGNSYPVKNTTQEALLLQQSLRAMRDTGVTHCVMEVSSHALAMGRVKGTQFRTAVFTNFTQDHLDYHETMERYLDAKLLLFSRLGNTFNPAHRQHAVINADDAIAADVRAVTAVEIVTYGIEQAADVNAKEIQVTSTGTQFTLHSFAGTTEISMQTIGKFNVYNALAAITVALIEGVPLRTIRQSLAKVTGIPGRFELIDEGQRFLVIVDYAHTPDGLINVLQTIREFAVGKIITVFGCGGDRDRAKRPLMGNVVATYSDIALVTSDNPRTEMAESILADIVPGIDEAGMDKSKYELIVDRQAAIQKAVEMASPNDVILIAGKGHETYNEINGVRYDFDDRIEARKALRSSTK